MASLDSSDPARGKTVGWTDVLEFVLRISLVVVGIPAVWILRGAGVIDINVWLAVGVSAVLVLIAAGGAAPL